MLDRTPIASDLCFGMTVNTENGYGTYLGMFSNKYYVLINQEKSLFFNKIVSVDNINAYAPLKGCWKCHEPINSWQNSTCPLCQYLLCKCGACSKEHHYYQLSIKARENSTYISDRLYLYPRKETTTKNAIITLAISKKMFPGLSFAVEPIKPFPESSIFQTSIEYLLDANVRFGLMGNHKNNKDLTIFWNESDKENARKAIPLFYQHKNLWQNFAFDMLLNGQYFS